MKGRCPIFGKLNTDPVIKFQTGIDQFNSCTAISVSEYGERIQLESFGEQDAL